MGYGAASDCPQLLTMIALCSRRGVKLPAADSLCLEFWGLWRGCKWETPREPEEAAALHAAAAFCCCSLSSGLEQREEKKLDVLVTKTGLAPRNMMPLSRRK